MNRNSAKDKTEKSVERRFPPVEVAKARIKLAILRHKVRVDKAKLASEREKEKVRL